MSSSELALTLSLIAVCSVPCMYLFLNNNNNNNNNKP